MKKWNHGLHVLSKDTEEGLQLDYEIGDGTSGRHSSNHQKLDLSEKDQELREEFESLDIPKIEPQPRTETHTSHRHHHHHTQKLVLGRTEQHVDRYGNVRTVHVGIRKKAAGIGIVICSIVLVFSVFAIFVWYGPVRWGKESLYRKADEQITELSRKSQQGEETQKASELAATWKPGWVSYKNKIYAYNEDLLTFLVMGIDSDKEVKMAADGISGGQADALFLLVMNPHTRKISVLEINRNAMTDIDVYDKKGNFMETGIGQICLQHGYGDGKTLSCERTVQSVRNLYHDVPVAGYISINMGAIATLNDAIGGVTLDILYDIPAKEGHNALSQGDTVHLMGDDAYWYTKYRDINVFDSVSERQKREEQYLAAFIPQLKGQIKTDPTAIASIYSAIAPYMVTDLDLEQAGYLGTEAAGYTFDTAQIYKMGGTTRVGDSGFEEFTCDEDQLYDQIIQVFYEEVLQQ